MNFIADNKKCQKCSRRRDAENLELFINDKGDALITTCKKCREVSKITRNCIVCKKLTASYGYPNENKKRYCEGCAKATDPAIVSLDKGRACKCGKVKRSTFGFKGGKPVCCKSCRELGMVDLVSDMCKDCEECQPSFNYPGEKAKYCEQCSKKYEGMVNVNIRPCKGENCGKTATFGKKKGDKPTYCAGCVKKYELKGYKNIVTNMCSDCEDKHPTYNYPGQTTPLYCADCAKKYPEMVDVKNPRCVVCKGPIASYNTPGEKGRKYCNGCRDKSNTVDVVNDMCADCGVSRPFYNVAGSEKAIYCKPCAEKRGIIVKDVINKECIKCGKDRATCNKPDEKELLYCNNCKEDDMINHTYKQCEVKDCSKIAIFGFASYSVSRCTAHREDEMIKNPTHKCETDEEKCQELAEYGTDRPRFCGNHKGPDDVNLVERKCKECGEYDLLNEDGICKTMCATKKEFNEKKEKEEKGLSKEKDVVLFLKRSLPEHAMKVQNTVLDSSCNRRRPDIGYDCGTHFVFVEVDEHQHKYGKKYTEPCEVARMIEIFLACNGKGAIFIRYNPDDYTSDKGVEKSKAKRQEQLLLWVKKSITSPPRKTENMLRVVFLYYDDHNPWDVNFQRIDLTNYDRQEFIDMKIKVEYLEKLFERLLI